MPRTFYRGYVIEVLWKAEEQYVVHLFPKDQRNASASRANDVANYSRDTTLHNSDGSYLYFRSVTDSVEAARMRIDALQDEARTAPRKV